MLSQDRSRQWAVDAINRTRESQNVAVWAYVIMPEHVHLLISPRNRDYEMRRILAALKAPVSRSAKAYFEDSENERWLTKLTVQHGNRKTFRFWQPGGGSDKNVWNSNSIEQVVDYIHANPVRRGITERPEDWPWSSARAIVGVDDVPLKIDKMDLL
ncbi:MAG: transposase [Planctomycetaceae bacterium]|nr:transposase [Planctomycetaceae bacterium]